MAWRIFCSCLADAVACSASEPSYTMRRFGRFARQHVERDLLDAALDETVRRARVDAERSSQIALDSTGLFLAHIPCYFEWREKRPRGQRG